MGGVATQRVERDEDGAAHAAVDVAVVRPDVDTHDGVLRRGADIFAALLLISLTAPFLVLGMLAVLIGSGGPVLFGHRRLGRNGVPFRCWKLRTMHVDAEAALDQVPALRANYVAHGYKLPLRIDPRVTRVGGILRRTHIDELPQLFNVLHGDMSLIGPRPVVAAELEEYGPDGAELLRAKPGIIGAWTSRGRARPPYPERAQLELDYVRNRSLGRDVRILLRAVPAIVRGQSESE